MTPIEPPEETNSFSVDDLKHIFERCNLDLVRYERIDEGVNTLFTVETGPDSQLVVVKAFTCSGAPGDVTTEVLLYRQMAAHTSIPVPTVIATNPSPVRCSPWAVLQKVPGENLDADTDRLPLEVLNRLYYEAGAYLGELHATFEFDSFGNVAAEGDALISDGSSSTWADMFNAILAPRLAGISSGRFSAFRPGVEQFLERTRYVLDDVDLPVLVHDDYRLGNMLVDPFVPSAPITAILDWESAFVGHHEYDLAIAEYMMIEQQFDDPRDESLRNRLRTRLYDGYSDRYSLTEDARAETRRHVYRVARILQHMCAFPVVWDGHSRARRAQEAEVLERHLQNALDAVY
ncbi:aminoglycoside phosphotransferase family protein [Natronoglomus mannanivorans]|uniref:Aminoglycoside phosphotransferase family protein n=1 Tax=Natronoglomus mannanivorans TaxID=2979990 RepID=A0AAP3E351_9EURY|nr:aminoglycoside phosphotransferase family protein [Halobacteria archaeon AArc-xg1-1]